jgi:rhodanese-related sulfurtransferase
LSTDTVSTIGVQRQYNYALQPMTREEFVRVVTEDQPDSPAYFTYDAVLNAKERPTLDQALAEGLTPLTLAALLELADAGAQILDTRSPADYEGAHLVGAVNIGLDGSFATWSGTLLEHDRPIVIVAAPDRVVEAATRLGRIGFDNVAGYLEGGMQEAESRLDLIGRTERITAATLAEQLADADPPFVLDVRAETELREMRIDGSVNIPLSRLLDHLDELPRDRAIVVHCSSGYRSAAAASLLGRAGFEHVSDLVGGLSRPLAVPSARPA